MPSDIVGFLRRAGAPPSAIIGVGRALERGAGERAVPVGSALLGMILAVTTLSGTVVFGASLTHLTTTPALYGQPFDAVFTNNVVPGAAGPSVFKSLVRNRHISQITAGIGGDVGINGRTVDAIASKSIRGATLLTAISGHLPQHDDEVTLGAPPCVSSRPTSVPLFGSRYRAPTAELECRRYRVVGVAAFPPDFGAGGLGTGATFSIGGLLAAQCAPGLSRSTCEKQASGNPNKNFLVRATRDRDGRAALLRLARQYSSSVQFPMAPTNLVNFGQAVNFPLILSLVIILFGLATLVHVLLVSLVRRSKESQILLAIGFVRRQVAFAVIWQALAIALIAVMVGVPLGIALGRVIWILFADNLGVVSIPVVEIATVGLVGIGTLVSALLLAVGPSLAAARRSANGLIRDER